MCVNSDVNAKLERCVVMGAETVYYGQCNLAN